MKLGGLEKLMARLCLKITPSQLTKLCASAVLSPATKETIRSSIKLLKTLRKRSRSIEAFISQLEKCINGLEDAQDIAALLASFRKTFPRLEVLEAEPVASLSGHKPTDPSTQQQMKQNFNTTLLRISDQLKTDELEVLVALSPTPEGKKESLDYGHKLFEEMQHRGCISYYDTELLDDLFRVLRLTTATDILEEYKQMYPELSVPRLDNHQSFGSGANIKHPLEVTQYTPLLRPSGLTPSHLTASQTTSHTPSQFTPHRPGFSTPQEESTPLEAASLTRVARPISSPVLSRTPESSINQRRFNDLHSVPGGSIQALSMSSSFSEDPIYPRPVSVPLNSAAPEVSIYAQPVNETMPTAPPLSDIQPAAKGTQGAEKFVSKGLYKPAVSTADPNLLNAPQHSQPSISVPSDQPVSQPSVSVETASTASTLSSYKGFDSNNFPRGVSVSSNRPLNKQPATNESNYRASPQFPTSEERVNSVPMDSSNQATDESYRANHRYQTPEERVDTGPKAGGVVTGAVNRAPIAGAVNRAHIEQNSSTLAKPGESSRSSVPVIEVCARFNGQNIPKQPVPVLNHSKQEQMVGDHFSSENFAVKSYHSSDEEPPSSGSSDDSDSDPEYPPVEDEAQETTPPLHRKRTRDQDSHDEMTTGQKRLRSSAVGMTTRSRSSSSGLLRWVGYKLGIVKQED